MASDNENAEKFCITIGHDWQLVRLENQIGMQCLHCLVFIGVDIAGAAICEKLS